MATFAIRTAQQPSLRMAAALAGPSRTRLVPVNAVRAGLLAHSRMTGSTSRTASLRSFSSTSQAFASASAPSTSASSPFRSTSQSQSNDRSQSQSQHDPDAEFESDSNPQPETDQQPKSAYARFKLLTKKYGWYALGMYTALSSIDFSLSFLLVHALGVERISPAFEAGMYQYRRIRFGAAEAERLGAEAREKAAQDKAQAEREVKEGKKKGGYWGSRTFWAELVLAYGIHKTALLPFRAGLTVAWTPKVVGWLTRRGWIGKVSRRSGCGLRCDVPERASNKAWVGGWIPVVVPSRVQ